MKQNPLNILIVALDFKPMTGGIAEYTHQIARHLHLAGDNITVLSKKVNKDREFDSTCPYNVMRYDYDAAKSNKILRYYNSFKNIMAAAKKQPADVLICNAVGSESHICWLVARLLNIPYCIFTHGLEVNNTQPKRSFKRLKAALRQTVSLKWADKVFCVSSFTRRLVTRLGVSCDKTQILHPGMQINCTAESPAGKILPRTMHNIDLTNKKVLLTVGRLVERKGIDKTIEALQIVKNKISGVLYIIAGDGPYRPVLEKMADDLKLGDNVLFTGYVSEEDKRFYYSVADVFVMPNRELDDGNVEGFGIVFLEANSFGKPVIGGKSGGGS